MAPQAQIYTADLSNDLAVLIAAMQDGAMPSQGVLRYVMYKSNMRRMLSAG
jgi:hypothetical protein